ncbi:hypothetical protein, partial [Bacillus pseudomycoides]|uniref:hypothetical protein n=1 Tax=Bacillus pseudomycoides TaxID=64104 RepID=UPI001C55834E
SSCFTYDKHTKISSVDQGIGSHYYFLYSRSEERAVIPLGFRIRTINWPSSLTLFESVFSVLVLEIVYKKWESISVS